MHFLVNATYGFLTLILLVFLNRLYSLYQNYIKARALRIPIVVRLESWQDPLWMVFGPYVVRILTSVRLWNPNAVDYSSFDWSQHDRFGSHARHGPAFAIVTPFKTNIIISDMDLTREVARNWRVWIKEPGLYAMMESFGKNVNSVNGDDWARNRKVTAPVFKEANSKLVWDVTLRQMNSAARTWMAKGTDGITLRNLKEDMNKIAMHVLMYAGFGRDYDFEKGVEVVESGHRISFGQAMHTCIGSIAFFLVPVTFAAAKLPPFMIPAGLKRLQIAVEEVRSFLKDAVDTERDALVQGIKPKDNLISSLVRANEAERVGAPGTRMVLSDEELYGNLFMFNMAGHESTSSSFSFAIPLLAAHPDIQNWIREEVDTVIEQQSITDYTEVFPKLVRTLALMYETQRFFSALPMLPKYTGSMPQQLTLNGHLTTVPAETFVSMNYNAIHFDPAVWGPAVNEFYPARWIQNHAGTEVFAMPEGADFVGWSYGPRVCPGKRFSQVEFVAGIAQLLRDWKLQPDVRKGESIETARNRVKKVLKNVKQVITLVVQEPDGAGVVLTRREG